MGADIGIQFIIGILTSVIGGILLSVMKPSHISFNYNSGRMIAWVGILILSIVIGILAAALGFGIAKQAFPAILVVAGLTGLVPLLSIIFSIGFGIFVMALFHNAICREIF